VNDLNRRVAEALGIRIYGASATDNGPCFGHDREWRNEWIELPGDDCADVPDWAHDLNAAFTLLEDMYCDIRSRPSLNDWRVIVGVGGQIIYHTSLATAICLGFLDRHAQKGQGDTEAGE